MAVTLADLEFEVVDRTKGLLQFPGVNLSILVNGSNPNLRGPIAQSLINLGIMPSLPNPTDGDVASLDPTQWFSLVELTTYYVIKKCLGNFVMTNEMAQDRRQEWDSTKRTFQAMMDSLALQYSGYLNIRRNPPIAGKYPSAVPPPVVRDYTLPGLSSVIVV